VTATSPDIQAKVEADLLYGDAQTALAAHDVQDAIEKWEAAAAIYHDIEDLLSEADSYLQVAPLYMAQGDFDTAMDRYLQAFIASAEVYEELIIEAIPYDKEVIARGDVLYQEGKTLFEQSEYDSAFEKFAQARTVYRSIEYGAGEVRTIMAQMEVRFAQEKNFAAVGLGLEAYAIASTLSLGTHTDELYISGLYQYETGDFQGAIATWEQVVERYIEEGDLADDAVTRSNLGNAYATLGRYDDALVQYDLALVAFVSLEDRANEATVRHNLGNVYALTGRFQKALSTYNQALVLWQALGDLVNEAATLNSLGLLYRDLGELDQAMIFFQEALALQLRLHDRAGEADSYNNMGYTHYTRSDYEAAQSGFEQALAIWRELDVQLKVSYGLTNLGNIYVATGQYPAALKSFHEALTTQEEVGDLGGQATTKANMAGIQVQSGDYQEALRLYQQALQIFQQTGNSLGGGNIMSNIGAVYLMLGDLEQAQMSVEGARKLFQEAGSPEREAFALNNLGLIAIQQGDPVMALANYQEALQIWQTLDSTAGQATALGNIGIYYLLQEQPEAALASLEAAIPLAQETGDPLVTNRILNMIGFAHSLLGQYDLAQAQHDQALVMADKISDPVGKLTAHLGLGVLSFGRKKPEAAFEHLEQAVDLLERLQGRLTVEELKTIFSGKFADAYELMVHVSLELDRPQTAFHYAERGRARTFLTFLGNQRVDPKGTEDTDLIQYEIQLRGELTALERQLQDEWNKPADKRSQQVLDHITANLETRRQEYERLLIQLQLTNPEYTTLVSVAPLTSEETQALLREQAPDTTLLAYFVGAEETVIFVVGPETFYAQAVLVTRQELRRQVNALLAQMKAAPLLASAWQEPAQALYDWLIAPVQKHLPSAGPVAPARLGIIPHDLLHYFPFGLLHNGENVLLDDYALFYAPSVSSLRFIFDKRHSQAGTLLAFANPEAPGQAYLSYALEEAQIVAALYETRPLVGSAASEGRFQAEAGKYGLIHIAAHGEYNPHSPLFSAILLQPDDNEDGRLETHEVFDLDLPQTDLVVLSACQTHLGELSGGDELVGLERAFIRAGSPSLLTTLWSVDDAATAELMGWFYTHLRAGVSKAEALRLAQLQTQKEYPEPYYWAGFVLVGDTGPPAGDTTMPQLTPTGTTTSSEPMLTETVATPQATPTEGSDKGGSLCGGAALLLLVIGVFSWRLQQRNLPEGA